MQRGELALGGRRRVAASHRDECGFTVLELLIVLAIVAVVAVVVHVETAAMHRRAVATSCAESVKQIEASAEVVRARTARYPAAADGTNGATTLLTSAGSLGRWPHDRDYALEWSGSDVEVTDLHHHRVVGVGAAACRALGS